jgi:hypothetical protein
MGKTIILIFFLIISISNFCKGQTHHFKLSAGLGLKKNFLYDYDKNKLKSNNFDVSTKINPFPIIIIDYNLNKKLDLEFSAALCFNSYYVEQALRKDDIINDFQYRIKTTTGNFCLGIKYVKNRHNIIGGINLDYNSLTSVMTSGIYYSDTSTFDFTYNLDAPWVSYFSQGLFIAYKTGLSKRLSLEIKYSQDSYRLPASNISTDLTVNKVTANYSGHIHPNYGYVGIILIYH